MVDIAFPSAAALWAYFFWREKHLYRLDTVMRYMLMGWILYTLTEGTPFAGGIFRMRLVLGKDFPAVPPKGYFLTKIFHPNVGHKGEICVNVLKRDWKAELGLRHVLLVRFTFFFFLILEPEMNLQWHDKKGTKTRVNLHPSLSWS